MATSALQGQSALFTLPPAPIVGQKDYEETITSYHLPVQLELKEKTSEKSPLGNGMSVYKVSKTGKRQQRRVAISPDHRKLLISTNKSALSRRVGATYGSNTFRKIEISSIDRIVRGQVTNKFVNKRTGRAATQNMPVSEDKLSLSIIFRVSSAATDRIVEEEDLEINSDSINRMASLDLVIPSHNDYELLVSSLKNLVFLHKKYASRMARDILLLQYHWMELGKDYNQRVSQSEWTAIVCSRMSSNVGRNSVLTLYRSFCRALHIEPSYGITIKQAATMLEHLRLLSLRMNKTKDPCDIVWKTCKTIEGDKFSKKSFIPQNIDSEMIEFDDNLSVGSHQTMYAKKVSMKVPQKGDVSEEYISAKEFLRFAREEQGEENLSLKDVQDIFEKLNAQTYASQLDKDGINGQIASSSFSKEYISKTLFLNYLKSDANDLFNPIRGERENEDLNQPLSSYWINSSHDTFLKRSAPKFNQIIQDSNMNPDVGMITNALSRGCRCLEVDIWDGSGEQRWEPVIRFDEAKTVGGGNPLKEGILFEDAIKAIYGFLHSDRNCLPIILMMEVHCSVKNQRKMYESLKNILGSEDILYEPDEDDTIESSYPSPNMLRGKVVIKTKSSTDGKTMVICDDYDDFVDSDPFNGDDDLMDLPGVGEGLFDSTRDLTGDPAEIVKNATIELNRSKKAADAAEEKAFNINVKVTRAQKFTEKIMQKAEVNVSYTERKLRQKNGRAKTPEHTVTFNIPEPVAEVPAADSHESDQYEDGSSVASRTVDTASVADRSMYTVESNKSKKGFFSKLLGWAASFDGEETTVGGSTYLDHDDRDAAMSLASDGSRDSVDSYYIFEFGNMEINVDHFNPGNLIKDLRDFNEEKKRHYKEKTVLEESMLAKRSISNVNKKLKEQEDEVVEDGVEVENFYSSTIDIALNEHKQAEESLEKAGKMLAAASANFTKRQQEFDKFKPGYRYCVVEDDLRDAIVKKKQAETAFATAQSEHQISEEKAVEIEETLTKAKDQQMKAQSKEKGLLEKENEIRDKIFNCSEEIGIINKEIVPWDKKIAVVKAEHARITNEINKMEDSHMYKVEKKQARRGDLTDGSTLKKHRAEVDKQISMNEKLQKLKSSKEELVQRRSLIKSKFDQANLELKDMEPVMRRAKEYVDNCHNYVDQLEQLVEEECDAAKMREDASENAENAVNQCETNIQNLKREYEELQHKFTDGIREEEVNEIIANAERLKAKLNKAEIVFRQAQENYKWADNRLKEANATLNENSDALEKAKNEAKKVEHRQNADDVLKDSAVTAYERLQNLKKDAKEAKKAAEQLSNEAEKAAARLRQAEDYQKRKVMAIEIDPSLGKLSLFESQKLKYWEESLILPKRVMHSISEGKMLQFLTNDEGIYEYNLKEFSQNHILRTFPSRHKKLRHNSSNFNPVMAWSLGSQIVSMNRQVSDAFVLVNDGRFRVNGSCGYVLKPPALRGINAPKPMQNWEFKILSGYNLPKTRKKEYSGSIINPRVRVTLYDGGVTEQTVKLSEKVNKNGLNPVWDVDEDNTRVIKFTDIKYPESAVVMFSVWDYNGEGAEDFIAAAAVPLDCMRKGWRSVQLFDDNHMRCGAHAFASLFIHAEAF